MPIETRPRGPAGADPGTQPSAALFGRMIRSPATGEVGEGASEGGVFSGATAGAGEARGVEPFGGSKTWQVAKPMWIIEEDIDFDAPEEEADHLRASKESARGRVRRLRDVV